MQSIQPETEQEIKRRLDAGHYRSLDDLLLHAFKALDASEWLERELLAGLEGEDVELNADEWASIEAEALKDL
ncbi:MAG: hypothetical protein SGI88_01865 [Candidatus Hydrogenedentes bacterium]|nr:hypothetical protein [Candidatus Hydrogenedentota bacterium]